MVEVVLCLWGEALRCVLLHVVLKASRLCLNVTPWLGFRSLPNLIFDVFSGYFAPVWWRKQVDLLVANSTNRLLVSQVLGILIANPLRIDTLNKSFR